jgi:hypothetical protein
MKKTLIILMAAANLTITTHVQAFTTGVTGRYGWEYDVATGLIRYWWDSYSDDGTLHRATFRRDGFAYSNIHPDNTTDAYMYDAYLHRCGLDKFIHFDPRKTAWGLGPLAPRW